jgi:hypothetical protein
MQHIIPQGHSARIHYPQSRSQKKREKRKGKEEESLTRANSSIRDERVDHAPARPVGGIILVMGLVKRTGPGKTRRDEGDVDWVDWMEL